MPKTIQMTNRKLQDFYRGLQEVGDLTGAIPLNFSMAVAGTMRLNIGYLTDMEKVLVPTKDFKKYVVKVNEIRKKYALKDKNGVEIRGEGKQYVIDPKVGPQADKELETLNESDEFKQIIADRQTLADDYEENLSKGTQVKVYQIDKSHLPESINPRQLEAIYDLVSNPDATPVTNPKPKEEPKKE